jgi:co-chaperonin GroES (HSP10)
MVLFVKYSGTEVKLEGIPMLVMTEKEVIAVIEETADVEPA